MSCIHVLCSSCCLHPSSLCIKRNERQCIRIFRPDAHHHREQKGQTHREQKGQTHREQKGQTHREQKGQTHREQKGQTHREQKGQTHREQKGQTLYYFVCNIRTSKYASFGYDGSCNSARHLVIMIDNW